MSKRLALALSVAIVLVHSMAFAQTRIEGTVSSTTLTKCDFKPGTCEGSLVLETKEGSKANQVKVKVPQGTTIKRGNDHLFLPGLKGQTVVISYVEEKGETVAKSIEVKAAKP